MNYYELIRDDAGKILKRERKAWGMSKKRLAKLTNTDYETIEQIEKGYVCMLDLKLLFNIAIALDVNYDSFLIRKLTNKEIEKFY